MDIRPLVIVKKERETYHINDEFEVAFDKVDKLGYFIEIESLKNFGDVKKTRQMIIELAEKIGINPEIKDLRGYPYLLLKKEGLV